MYICYVYYAISFGDVETLSYQTENEKIYIFSLISFLRVNKIAQEKFLKNRSQL